MSGESRSQQPWATIWAISIAASAGASHPLLLITSTIACVARSPPICRGSRPFGVLHRAQHCPKLLQAGHPLMASADDLQRRMLRPPAPMPRSQQAVQQRRKHARTLLVAPVSNHREFLWRTQVDAARVRGPTFVRGLERFMGSRDC